VIVHLITNLWLKDVNNKKKWNAIKLDLLLILNVRKDLIRDLSILINVKLVLIYIFMEKDQHIHIENRFIHLNSEELKKSLFKKEKLAKNRLSIILQDNNLKLMPNLMQYMIRKTSNLQLKDKTK